MTGPDWPFTDPQDTVVITLDRVLRGDAPLLLVTHDEDDGAWQFLDGGHVFEDDAVPVHLGEMAQFDPGVLELADLPAGWHARRSGPGQPWRRSPGEPPPTP
jgi:hypothetical protein